MVENRLLKRIKTQIPLNHRRPIHFAVIRGTAVAEELEGGEEEEVARPHLKYPSRSTALEGNKSGL